MKNLSETIKYTNLQHSPPCPTFVSAEIHHSSFLPVTPKHVFSPTPIPSSSLYTFHYDHISLSSPISYILDLCVFPGSLHLQTSQITIFYCSNITYLSYIILIIQFNIRGLAAHHKDLCHIISLHSPLLIGLQETFHHSLLVSVPGYTFVKYQFSLSTFVLNVYEIVPLNLSASIPILCTYLPRFLHC